MVTVEKMKGGVGVGDRLGRGGSGKAGAEHRGLRFSEGLPEVISEKATAES